jgi:signal recognition particle subunit SRP54
MAWFTKKKKTEENINENLTMESNAAAEKAAGKTSSNVKDIAARMMSGQFDMNDMLAQMKQIKKMSNFSGLLKMVPGMSSAVGAMKEKIKDGSVDRQIKILEAMTAAERADPDKIFANAKTRIAEKGGVSVREVEQIIKQYQNMKRQMAMVQRMGGMDAMMEKIKQGAPGGGNAPIGK